MEDAPAGSWRDEHADNPLINKKFLIAFWVGSLSLWPSIGKEEVFSNRKPEIPKLE